MKGTNGYTNLKDNSDSCSSNYKKNVQNNAHKNSPCGADEPSPRPTRK